MRGNLKSPLNPIVTLDLIHPIKTWPITFQKRGDDQPTKLVDISKSLTKPPFYTFKASCATHSTNQVEAANQFVNDFDIKCA